MVPRANTTLFVRDWTEPHKWPQTSVRDAVLVKHPGDDNKLLLLGGYIPETNTTGQAHGAKTGSGGAAMANFTKDKHIWTLNLTDLTVSSTSITSAGTGNHTVCVGSQASVHTVGSPGSRFIIGSGGEEIQPMYPWELRKIGNANLEVKFLLEDIAAFQTLNKRKGEREYDNLKDHQGCSACSMLTENDLLFKWGGFEMPPHISNGNGAPFNSNCMRICCLTHGHPNHNERLNFTSKMVVGVDLPERVFEGSMFNIDTQTLLAVGIQTTAGATANANTVYFMQLMMGMYSIKAVPMKPKIYGTTYVQISSHEIWAMTWDGGQNGGMAVTSMQYNVTNFNEIEFSEQDFLLEISSPKEIAQPNILKLMRIQTAAHYDAENQRVILVGGTLGMPRSTNSSSRTEQGCDVASQRVDPAHQTNLKKNHLLGRLSLQMLHGTHQFFLPCLRAHSQLNHVPAQILAPFPLVLLSVRALSSSTLLLYIVSRLLPTLCYERPFPP